MLEGMLFQRIDPRTRKDLSPINLLVLGMTRRVLSNAEPSLRDVDLKAISQIFL